MFLVHGVAEPTNSEQFYVVIYRRIDTIPACQIVSHPKLCQTDFEKD